MALDTPGQGRRKPWHAIVLEDGSVPKTGVDYLETTSAAMKPDVY